MLQSGLADRTIIKFLTFYNSCLVADASPIDRVLSIKMSTPEMIEKLNALWDEETQCSICLECFDETHRVKTFLDCRHYFCLSCIKECRSLPGSSGKHILCPMCRSKTSCEELAKLALTTQQPLPLALQQLLQILKSPSTGQQQQQVIHILRSNPQLMAAFVRQRAMLQQQGLQNPQP